MNLNNFRLKGFLFILILLVSNIYLIAQENAKIYLLDNTVIEGEVLKVTSNNVEINPKGEKPFLLIARSDVNIIIYSDNTVVNFQNTFKQDKILVSDSKSNLIKNKILKEKNDLALNFPFNESEAMTFLKEKLETKKSEIREISNYPLPHNYPIPNVKNVVKLNKIKKIKKIDDDGVWDYTIYEYDPNGNLLKHEMYQDKSTKNLRREKEYSYNTDGTLKETLETDHKTYGKNEFLTTYTYKNDTIYKRYYINGIFSSLSIQFKNLTLEVLNYTKGFLISIDNKTIDGYKTDTYYKRTGKAIQHTQKRYYVKNNKVFKFTSPYLYKETLLKYNKKGRLKIEKRKSIDEIRYNFFKYDSNNMVEKISHTDKEKGSNRILRNFHSRFEYEYFN